LLVLAAEMSIKPEAQQFALEETNRVLLELKNRKKREAEVLRID